MSHKDDITNKSEVRDIPLWACPLILPASSLEIKHAKHAINLVLHALAQSKTLVPHAARGTILVR